MIVNGGLRYQVNLAGGQKTGFYLDQRENRKAAAAYFRDRRVLDMFCYSGGFALCASALGGARDVLGVDASRRAVALAEANARLNGLANVRFEAADCFQKLESLRSAGEKFGGLVLDPPRFANSRRSLDDALRAYHHLNRLGVELLEPGGILVTCSCSGHVSREDFFDMLLGVAQQTGRELQILDQRGAAPDHPIALDLSGERIPQVLHLPRAVDWPPARLTASPARRNRPAFAHRGSAHHRRAARGLPGRDKCRPAAGRPY